MKWYYVPIVYVVYCAVGMLALAFISETRDVDLEEIPRPATAIDGRIKSPRDVVT
jgi:hypothetical protein